MKNVEKLPAPPYISFRTLTNFVEWLEAEGIPQQIDRSFWGRHLSGAYGSQLVAALKFLHLITEDNKPTTVLDRFVKSKDERREIMADLLRQRYPEINAIGLTNATPKMLRDAFEQYSITGPTLRKAQTFFVHAAIYAGLPLSTFITKAAKQRGGDGIKRSGTRARKAPSSRGKKAQSDGSGDGGDDGRGADVVLSGRPLVAAVMKQLPGSGEWTQGERDRWLDIFTKALDWDVKVTSKVK